MKTLSIKPALAEQLDDYHIKVYEPCCETATKMIEILTRFRKARQPLEDQFAGVNLGSDFEKVARRKRSPVKSDDKSKKPDLASPAPPGRSQRKAAIGKKNYGEPSPYKDIFSPISVVAEDLGDLDWDEGDC